MSVGFEEEVLAGCRRVVVGVELLQVIHVLRTGLVAGGRWMDKWMGGWMDG